MVRAKPHGRIVVEVAYARAEQQTLVELELEQGATARQAIETSGILDRYPEIDLRINKIGVFGEPAGLDRPLRDLDRVEIYRPLPRNPGELRRRRAESAERNQASLDSR